MNKEFEPFLLAVGEEKYLSDWIFMMENEKVFYYKNSVTREYLFISQEGKFIKMGGNGEVRKNKYEILSEIIDTYEYLRNS